jgi:hypothetical protein
MITQVCTCRNVLITHNCAHTAMRTLSADPIADTLMRQIRLIKRIGTPDQKAAAPRWENLIRSAAETDEPMAVNFATTAAPQTQEAGK